MPRIKIISNPYLKEIKYQKWNSEGEAWDDIVYENNRNSRLLNGDLIGGFFPYKAKEIVDLLKEEYGIADETLEIIFEGTRDEYKELEEVCEEECFADCIKLSQSTAELKNARDILPDIRKLFQKINPLITQSIDENKIQYELNRFSDASNDTVPICVIGNYSVGKSTIINAIIGNEILPYGDDPVTAKLYKISRSEYSDRAFVTFQFQGIDIKIQFTDIETKIEDEQYDVDIARDILEMLQNTGEASISRRVNKVLSFLNDYEKDVVNPEISDLIEINIPFGKGVLARSKYPFVIFDTPGSNSFSNTRHLQILKEAMSNMTNGLPIVLSTSKSLDSTDNEKLYRIISDLDELDSRFTLIIINHYDMADMINPGASVENQKRILNQALPRNLYSGGLFYLSPIMGLGVKTHGSFENSNYKNLYDMVLKNYENPDNENYRRLYLSNIQPIQLKRKSERLAASRKNVVYANSGLFTVENEIETFLSKYSAYNKCIQSKEFLNRIIQITEKEISDKKDEYERLRESIKEQMDESEKNLNKALEDKAFELKEQYITDYPENMRKVRDTTDEMISENSLKNQRAVLLSEQEELLGDENSLTEEKTAEDDEVKKVNWGLIPEFFERNPFPNLRLSWGNASSDEKDKEENNSINESQMEKDADEKIVDYVNDRYAVRMKEICDSLESNSKEYWTDKSEQLRQELINIVGNSGGLTELRQKEVEKIIISYKKLSFKEETTDSSFNENDLKWRFSLLNFFTVESKYINLKKTNKKYHAKIESKEKEQYEKIKESHCDSANEWVQNLLNEIKDNIFEYSLK